MKEVEELLSDVLAITVCDETYISSIAMRDALIKIEDLIVEFIATK